jgi:hypothetical protein
MVSDITNPKKGRRTFLKEIGMGLGAAGVGAILANRYDSVLASTPSTSNAAIISQWAETQPDVIVFYDQNGAAYARDAADGSMLVSAGLLTSTGSARGGGTAGASSTTGAVQEALKCLTTGRTYKQGVALLGMATISSVITVPSYTVLDLRRGYVKLVNGSSALGTGLVNCNVGAGTTDVEIWGGYIDGNRTNQTVANSSGIVLGKATNILVKGVTIKNIKGSFGIYHAGGCVNNTIEDCVVDSTDHGGIVTDVSGSLDNQYVKWIKNKVTNYCQVTVATAMDAFHTEGTVSNFNRDFLIFGNEADGSGHAGTTGASNYCLAGMIEGRVIGNRGYNAYTSALAVSASQYVTVSDNYLDTPGVGAVSPYNSGIQVDDTGVTPATFGCQFIGNKCVNIPAAGWGIQERGTATGNLYLGTLLKNFTNGIQTSATPGSIVKSTQGFTFAATSQTAGANAWTSTALPYDSIWVVTTIGGATNIILDGSGGTGIGVPAGTFQVGMNFFVGAGHVVYVTWATTAPVFAIRPV